MNRIKENSDTIKTISVINDRLDFPTDRVWKISITLLLSDISKSLAIMADKMMEKEKEPIEEVS